MEGLGGGGGGGGGGVSCENESLLTPTVSCLLDTRGFGFKTTGDAATSLETSALIDEI